MARPTNIRTLIEDNRAEIETFGRLHSARVNPGPRGGRPGLAYYLTEPQAIDVCALSRTEAGRRLRPVLIRVFLAWRHGHLKPHQPTLPDFSNPAIAARAWAAEFEAKQLAEKLAAERAVLLAEQEPIVAVAERAPRRGVPGGGTPP